MWGCTWRAYAATFLLFRAVFPVIEARPLKLIHTDGPHYGNEYVVVFELSDAGHTAFGLLQRLKQMEPSVSELHRRYRDFSPELRTTAQKMKLSGSEFMLMASGDLDEHDIELLDEMEGVKSIQRSNERMGSITILKASWRQDLVTDHLARRNRT